MSERKGAELPIRFLLLMAVAMLVVLVLAFLISTQVGNFESFALGNVNLSLEVFGG